MSGVTAAYEIRILIIEPLITIVIIPWSDLIFARANLRDKSLDTYL